ncbi:hypothetical protein [Roseburia sp. 1XD42-69]|uniref:hypothetical protein n=1 Tax=Roseburia sp. 1XD42-69 TaxID=2320088 RepID=UPI000EA3121F|nr:hypothetical protein [Roseburia sp. 1XD42-69]RKJ68788.1 hypothetical protein D7Y06_00630 [Roseburia sp. 1XD42-69]
MISEDIEYNKDIFLSELEASLREVNRKINMSKLENRKIGTISSEEALKDVVPIQWREDLFNDNE